MSAVPFVSIFGPPISCSLHVSDSLAKRLGEEAFPDLVDRLNTLIESGRLHTSMVPPLLATAFFWSLAAAGFAAFGSFRPEEHQALLLFLAGFVPPNQAGTHEAGASWREQVLRPAHVAKKSCRIRHRSIAHSSPGFASPTSKSPELGPNNPPASLILDSDLN